jgi:hypothetical protein
LGGDFINTSGAWRGENVNVCLDVIASEAKIPWGVDSDQI